ncbi:MAG: DUF3299 domain-containing protein [Saccharospirillum sp.]|nr:DUF3299 domain-containing protein [Saccharospirillum sp.]
MQSVKLTRHALPAIALSAVLLAGCSQEPSAEAEIDAEILEVANRPAEAPDQNGLSADELALEPTDLIEPLSEEEAQTVAYREFTWDDLLPEDFDFSYLQDVIDIEDYDIMSMEDDDPEAQRLYADLIVALADVPFVESLHGQEGRIPGFLVPLEFEAEAVKEFFLVPYFGACIHTPPPPANQIVHVVLDEAIPFDNIYEPYWIEGAMSVTRTETDLGTAGYRMQASSIRVYE